MGNTGTFVLDLTNAEGDPANEPDCQVEFLRLDQVTIARAQHVQFPPAHSFDLPAFPQGQNLHCSITPSLYRPIQSTFFTLQDGGELRQTVSVMRDPAKWQPDFAPWLSLSADFVPLQKSLDKNFVKLKHGPDVGIMSPDVYDGMNSPALLMAKMALLNLFAVLRTQQDPLSSQPWFNSVRKILVVDQERFVAIVDPGLHDSVDNILKNMSSFGKQGFFPGEVTLHTDNIPSDYQLTEEMISVKRTYEEGNLQLTLGKARNNGVDCVLLDCDMDEHSNLFLHTGDLFKHTFTGGTNPIDIHEYIVNLQQGVDLGYALAPRGTGAEPMLLAKAKAAPRPRAAKRAAATA